MLIVVNNNFNNRKEEMIKDPSTHSVRKKTKKENVIGLSEKYIVDETDTARFSEKGDLDNLPVTSCYGIVPRLPARSSHHPFLLYPYYLSSLKSVSDYRRYPTSEPTYIPFPLPQQLLLTESMVRIV